VAASAVSTAGNCPITIRCAPSARYTTTWCSAATTLGLVTVIDTAAPMRGRAMLTHGEVIAALVANRLCGPPHAALTAADVLSTYQDQWIIEQRHRDPKQTLPVRPVFLHNDDRIQALIAVVGIALLVFGLIEAELRRALGPGTPLPGILPEHRDAVPTARRRPDRLRRPARHLHHHRPPARPAHPHPAAHPRPPRHPLPWPETHSTTTNPISLNHNLRPCGKRV
jgi:hypothetical protein